ncbi:MAG TPA: glycosyltransferase family 4 protein [Chloroflexota bacterium]|nr:glycosyltransferase family 4 protein [Chloroflexota bacterium]
MQKKQMVSRLRVVMGTQFPRDTERIQGGVQGVASCLAEAIADRGDVELHVVSCPPRLLKRETETRNGYTIHWVPMGRLPVGIAGLTSAAWAVHGVYRWLAPHVIHAQGTWTYSVRKLAGTPLLLTIHGVEALEKSVGSQLQYAGALGAYRRLVELRTLKISLRNATGLVSISGPYVPSLISEIAALPGRVFNIDNPVLPTFWAVKSSEAHAPPVILCVGSVIPRKNALALVQALPLIHKMAPCARIEIAGSILDRTYYSNVLSLGRALGVSRFVTFLGQLDQPALLLAYDRATVVAHAALQETAPLAIAQAMAAERPVVAMNVGGVSSIVDDAVTGYITDPADISGFAERIASVLIDRVLGRQLGVAGRKVASTRFKPSVVAQSTVDAYLELGGSVKPGY